MPLQNDLEESRSLNRYLVLAIQNASDFVNGSETRQKNVREYLMKLKGLVAENKKLADELTMNYLQTLN